MVVSLWFPGKATPKGAPKQRQPPPPPSCSSTELEFAGLVGSKFQACDRNAKLRIALNPDASRWENSFWFSPEGNHYMLD